jgi:two-component system response regulator PilR (NtrC family)
VVVNAGAIPDALAESQLFGHERGAFTGAVSTQLGLIEQADGGTLFLDEIGELGPALQVKLLRVLQERAVQRLGAKVARRVDCRVLAATHRDLTAEVRAGRFRQDLFYRLNVIEVRLPPLRERAEDLAALVDVLLIRLARALGRPVAALSPEALSALRAHDWPGNIRELSNVLERALVLRPLGLRTPLGGDEVQAALGIPSVPPARASETAGPSLALKIAELERTEIEAALRSARGVKARAAVELGMSRPTLDKKIAELGIDLWKERGD